MAATRLSRCTAIPLSDFSKSIRTRAAREVADGEEMQMELPAPQPLSVLGVDPDTHGAFALLSLTASGRMPGSPQLSNEEDWAAFSDEGVKVVLVDTPVKQARSIFFLEFIKNFSDDYNACISALRV